jgi:hypothetical protein
MRIFKLAQEENDLLGDSFNEVLKEVVNPPTPTSEAPLKRSIDTSAYHKPGVFMFKCATYAGWNLKNINKNASRCHADALQLADGFKAAGMEAECTEVGNSLIYNGGGTIYVKCTVAVHSKSNNFDELMSLAKKLGVKR